MFPQLIIGITLVVVSVVVQVVFIELAARRLRKTYGAPDKAHPSFAKFVSTLSAVTLWLLMGLLLSVSIWCALFYQLNIFESLEESFYFVLVAFTTLGFGDITLPHQWRILSGFVATSGFLLFGLNTAVLLEVMIRLRSSD